MREYLVVHEKNNFCGITIEPAGKVYAHRTECWAIRTGGQFLFARSKIVRMLDKFHIGGGFDRMAMYAVDFDQMCTVIESQMGPSDRKRFEAVDQSVDRSKVQRWHTGAKIGSILTSRAVGTSLLMLGRVIRLLLVVVITPFIIMFFNKRNK